MVSGFLKKQWDNDNGYTDTQVVDMLRKYRNMLTNLLCTCFLDSSENQNVKQSRLTRTWNMFTKLGSQWCLGITCCVLDAKTGPKFLDESHPCSSAKKHVGGCTSTFENPEQTSSFFCTPGMAAMVPYTIRGQASACIPSWDCPEPGDAGRSDRIGCQKSWILRGKIWEIDGSYQKMLENWWWTH